MTFNQQSAIRSLSLLLICIAIPASAQTAATPEIQHSPGEQILAATGTVDSYWLPGWGAVPPKRTDDEKALLPGSFGWTQVWRYEAPTFEFAYQHREGRPLKLVMWPDEPRDSSIIFREKNLTFSQELVVERNGALHSFLPDPAFEVRSGTETSRIIRITGTAAEMRITLEYEFEVGVPGPVILVTIQNPLEEDVSNLRVTLRSAQRGSWDTFTVIDRPGGKMTPAKPNPHPEKGVYFTVRSNPDDVDVTFGQSDNTGLYYTVAPGEWSVDLTHNLIKLGKRSEVQFVTGIILLPDAQGGIKVNLKILRLMLPDVYMKERPEHLSRGFSVVESPVRLATESPAAKHTSEPQNRIRGVALAPPGMALPPGIAADKDKQLSAPALNVKTMSESEQNAVIFSLAGGAQKAVETYAGVLPHGWILDSTLVDVAGLAGTTQPSGQITWTDQLIPLPFGQVLQSLIDSGKDPFAAPQLTLIDSLAEASASHWSAHLPSATSGVPLDGFVIMMPLVSDNAHLLGAPVKEAAAVYRALARLDKLALCIAYGGMDDNLLAQAVRSARDAGVKRVYVALYPDLWNDPAIILRNLAAARYAGASGAIAFSLSGKWPNNKTDASWIAWSLGTKAFFPDGDTVSFGGLTDAGPLLRAMSSRQWTVVASPLDQYKSEITKIEKIVPHRMLKALNLPPAQDTRSGTLAVYIGIPQANLGIMHALKTEECGIRAADLAGLERDKGLLGYGKNKLLITGVEKKGVDDALGQFLELCKAFEPRVKPEKKD